MKKTMKKYSAATAAKRHSASDRNSTNEFEFIVFYVIVYAVRQLIFVALVGISQKTADSSSHILIERKVAQ